MQGISEEQKKSQEVRGGMIDIEHAKQEFENYLDEYDRQDEQIYLKIEHTYGVDSSESCVRKQHNFS